MAWRKTDPNEWNASAFRVIGREWLLLVTEGERPNAMTASWGGFGMLWNRPVVLLWVRPERYSYGLLTQNERFSVCVLPERYREAYRICGSMSGRETDKIARSGLTVQRVNGVACIRESRAVLLCRRQYTQAMIPQGYAEPALLEEVRAKGNPHHLFIGEVEELLLAGEGAVRAGLRGQRRSGKQGSRGQERGDRRPMLHRDNLPFMSSGALCPAASCSSCIVVQCRGMRVERIWNLRGIARRVLAS